MVLQDIIITCHLFIQVQEPINVYMYSYFPRTIKESNSLPDETVMADSLITFCNYLKL